MPVKMTDRYLSEVVALGGLTMTRATAYSWVLEETGCQQTADYFAFGPNRPKCEGEPLTLAQVQEVTATCQ